MEPMLEVIGVSKNFGGLPAADHIDMRVLPGEVHGLIGPNGAGKTTLLNLISGIYEVDAGKIILDGQEITHVPAHDRAKLGLARTFQAPRFLQRSSIRENIMVGMDLANKIGYVRSFFGCHGKVRDLTKELTELMHIADFPIDWDDDIDSLSYGQRKLLEIVRALLTDPKVMLVDEPAAGLNSSEINKAMNLLDYAANHGIGVVLIEHSMDMIMTICHNITVISFGKVIGEGTPQEVSSNEAVIEAYLGRSKNAART